MKLFKVVIVGFFCVVGVGLLVLMSGGGETAASTTAPQWQASGLPSLTTELVADGFDQPVDIAHAGDGRLFVVEQAGLIRIANSSSVPVPFLDITDRVHAGGEQGLLGLAFDPNYALNGYFYVNYTHCTAVTCPEYGETPNLYTRISRFSVTNNPNIADPNSELIILEIQQPYGNHNGGDLNFGPDGYLYIGMGDGGDAGDPENRAQSLDELLGKMLRLDVHGGGLPPQCGAPGNYTIPPDNPYLDNSDACGEIWAVGLRNPWRFSFDRETGDMFIGDVGQQNWEEVNFQPAGIGRYNWGWRCYEGNEPYNTDGCGPEEEYDFPFATYSHSQGCAVTGGYIYRGGDYPALTGFYIFGDYCSGNVWLAQDDGQGGWEVISIGTLPELDSISTFGEGCDGEWYVANYDSGRPSGIYQIQVSHLPQSAFGTLEPYAYLPLILKEDGTPEPTPTATAEPPPACN
jgi:glucose/arabinose dehydrogenase